MPSKGARPSIGRGAQAGDSSLAARTLRASSALLTERGRPWKTADLRPDVDRLVEVFGPERLMFGSHWPGARMALASHAEVVDLASSLLAEQLGLAETAPGTRANAGETYHPAASLMRQADGARGNPTISWPFEVFQLTTAPPSTG